MITAKKRKDLSEKLVAISCSAKDKSVYSTKHGIVDGIAKSNEETGKIFGMTAEGVRLRVAEVEKLIQG